jgi:hypothetical protein
MSFLGLLQMILLVRREELVSQSVYYFMGIHYHSPSLSNRPIYAAVAAFEEQRCIGVRNENSRGADIVVQRASHQR